MPNISPVSYNPFRLPFKSPFWARTVEKCLALDRLARRYERCPKGLSSYEFLQYTLKELSIQVVMQPSAAPLQAIPKQGPLLVVANHPLGGLEGVAIAHALMSVRADVQVLTNELLTWIPELQPVFIGVDVLSNQAAQANVKGLKQASRHLAQGGTLLLFPSGMVSAFNWKTRCIEDRQWNSLVGRLLRRYQAHCLPVYVHGRNSRWFYGLGLIHPGLRTLMLPRELDNKQGKRLQLSLGQVIAPDVWSKLADDQAITQYVRRCTDELVG